MKWRCLVICVIALCGNTHADTGQQDAGTTRLELWAQMRIGTDGRADNVRFPDAAQYSPELLSALGLRIALARFEPFELDGQAIPVETPARVTIAADGARGEVRIETIYLAPRPVHRIAPYYPQRDRLAGRNGNVVLSCVVRASGACEDIKTHADSKGSIEMVRAAKAALARWRFEPQVHDGVALDTPMLVPFGFGMVGESEYKEVLAGDPDARMRAARSMVETTHRPQHSLGGPQRISGGTFLNEGW